MKAMIIVLSPRESRDLLNGDLSVLVRKKFPKDYIGWIYIYCMKDRKYNLQRVFSVGRRDYFYTLERTKECSRNGKVVARFWCDKVEEISFYQHRAFFNDGHEKKPTVVWQDYHTKSYACGLLEEPSCLTHEELHDYLKGDKGYAIHITKVEPFDKPKEIKEFTICLEKKHKCRQKFSDYPCKKCVSMNLLTRAPRNGWCYVAV